MRYGLIEEFLLSLIICLGNFYQKENLHSFTTPRACPTKAICWPSWYKSYTYVPCCCIELHQTLWPSEMSFIHVWSRSRALHQLNFYTGSQLCHSIHPQNKTPRLMISLSSIFQMRHGLSKKKRKKMACPRCMTQKNGHINVHEKKELKNIYTYIAMSSCYPNKGERDS